jgi:hypothetical protein
MAMALEWDWEKASGSAWVWDWATGAASVWVWDSVKA